MAQLTWFAIAVVIVHKLNTILSSDNSARIRQTLIDVSFASRSNKSKRAAAFETADFVNASTVVVASSRDAVIDVYITDYAQGS